MTLADTLLTVRDLSYHAPDGRPLVQKLNFQLNTGQLIIVSGPNGIGKSTLLQVLLGHMPKESGDVELNISHKEIFYLPQLQNRAFHIPLRLRDILSFSNEKNLPRDGNLLQSHELDLNWNGASGGERQKTLLTLGFMDMPKLMILDEPMNHLDMPSRKLLKSALAVYLTKNHGTVIMVSHERESDFDKTISTSYIELARGSAK